MQLLHASLPTRDPLTTMQHSNNGTTKLTKFMTPKFEPCETPLLTLYTTFKNEPHKKMSSINVIRNWGLFYPCVQPLLFVQNSTDNYLIKLALEHSWIIKSVPKVNHNNVPVFKHMYFKARQLMNSTFHGYSNGDILYDELLLSTLRVVKKLIDQENSSSSYLITGQRRNYNIRQQSLYRSREVKQLARHLSLHGAGAQDYFIIAGDAFPWRKIPDVVIGRDGMRF